VALQEAHLVRRQAREKAGNATGGTSSDTTASPLAPGLNGTASAPLLPTPVPGGEGGNSFVSFVPYQVVSWEPRAVYFPGFLDPERCQHIIGLASKHLAPSGLALRKGETAENSADVRTSQGTFLTRRDDPEGVLDYLEKRIADATMMPQRHGEPFNVLRYEQGQKYDSHYDTFDPESYGPQTSQRVASFLIYLNEWESGGETVFPLEGANGLKRLAGIDYRSCAQGLKVKPLKAGDALLFYSVTPEGGFDKHALHGGCPVEEGVKWVATKWIRDKAFG
jgi:prolyl 4-hydroxylase